MIYKSPSGSNIYHLHTTYSPCLLGDYMGVSKNSGLLWKTLLKWMILGEPLFLETSIYITYLPPIKGSRKQLRPKKRGAKPLRMWRFCRHCGPRGRQVTPRSALSENAGWHSMAKFLEILLCLGVKIRSTSFDRTTYLDLPFGVLNGW